MDSESVQKQPYETPRLEVHGVYVEVVGGSSGVILPFDLPEPDDGDAQ